MSVELGFLEFGLFSDIDCSLYEGNDIEDLKLQLLCGYAFNSNKALHSIQSDFLIIQESLNKEIPSNGGGFPTLPEGAGVEIGFALLALASVAFGIRFIARLILNR